MIVPDAPNRSRALGYALIAVAATSWGTWPLFLRHAAMPPSLSAAIVMAIMTFGTVPMLVRDRLRSKPTRAQWAQLAWLGVADALNVVLLFAAYARTSVAIAVLTHYLTPLFVALAAPLVVAERMQRRTLGAVAFSFAGLILLLEPWRATFGDRDLVGAACGAASAAFYASNVLVNKRLTSAFSGSELVVFHGLVATPLLVVMVPASATTGVSGHALAVLVLGAFGPGVLGGLFFVWGLRRVPATHASVLTLIEPLVAVLCGAVAFGEVLGPWPLFGGLLILLGAIAVISAPTRAEHG